MDELIMSYDELVQLCAHRLIPCPLRSDSKGVILSDTH